MILLKVQSRFTIIAPFSGQQCRLDECVKLGGKDCVIAVRIETGLRNVGDYGENLLGDPDIIKRKEDIKENYNLRMIDISQKYGIPIEKVVEYANSLIKDKRGNVDNF